MNFRKTLFTVSICIVALTGCKTREKAPKDDDLSLLHATQTLDSLYANYSVPGVCLLRENYPSNLDNSSDTYRSSIELNNMPNQYSYLWPFSGTFSAVNALLATTGNKDYKTLLDNKVLPGLEEYFDSDRNPPGYASYIKSAPQSDRFYDDNIWVGINFIDAYLSTKDKGYLQKAQLIWNFIESGKDNKLGGGIYWCEQRRESKNACSNAPGSVFALKLYQATHNKSYLNEGIHLYKWTQTHLQDSTDFLYFDNINLDGKVNKAKFAYNSGQMMQSATLLYKLTDENKYLTDAQNIAKGCHNYFFTNFTPKSGSTFKIIKKGDIWFAAVMLRGFIELYQADNDKTYLNSFNQSLDYAWLHARDKKGLFNTDFSGSTNDKKRWLLTQAAMIEMYARLAAINEKKEML